MNLTLDLRCGVSGDMLLSALLDMYSRGSEAGPVLEMLSACGSVISETRVRKKMVKRSGGPATGLDVDFERFDGSKMTGKRMMDLMDEALSLSDCDDLGKRLAKRMLRTLLESEMAVHGARSFDDLHLHETATPDTLVDMIGISHLYSEMELDGEWIAATPISLGMGTLGTEHGVHDIPVPAVRHMLRGLPARLGPVNGELATPTGLATARSIVEIWMDEGDVPDGSVIPGEVLGRGAGSREYPSFENVLKIIRGEPE